MKDRVTQQMRYRKIRDWSLVLVLVGTVLLMPPVAEIFQIRATILGIPAPLIFVFVIWALLILCAALLSRSLNQEDDPGSTPDGPGGDY